MRRLSFCLLLLSVLLLGNGCTYFMFWQTAKYEHDDSRADRQMEQLEEERAVRMQGNKNYNDVELKEITSRSSVGQPGGASRPLTIDELRAQQEKERQDRARRKRR